MKDLTDATDATDATDVTVGGIVVKRTSERSAIVSIEVEFDMPELADMTEEERAERMAYITALGTLANLWAKFRSRGWSVKELVDLIEGSRPHE